MSLINDILLLLAERNKKQSDLCAYLGINTSTMTNWKNRNTDPPAKYIIPICEFFDISPYFLLTGKEKQPIAEAISEDEQQCIEKFRRLDDINKGKILERMEVMLENCPNDLLHSDITSTIQSSIKEKRNFA